MTVPMMATVSSIVGRSKWDLDTPALCVDLGVKVRVLIEVNVGLNRAGVEPGEAAVRLSEYAASLPGLSYSGLMAWEAHATTILDPVEKRTVITRDIGKLTQSADLCREAGLP